MTALDYVEALPPAGSDSWESWWADQGVPPNELADGATITDPAGVGPRITFLRVPEPKSAKTASISISRRRAVDTYRPTSDVSASTKSWRCSALWATHH